MKPKSPAFHFLLRWLRAVALVLAVGFSLGASNSGARYNNLNHRLMCVCGCNELLGECNHVSCPSSGPELAELRADLAASMNDRQIFAAFAAKYGVTVLAAPPTRGFDLIAWIAPFAVLLAAILGTVLLVRRWAIHTGHPLPAQPIDETLRARIRRETDGEGGYPV